MRSHLCEGITCVTQVFFVIEIPSYELPSLDNSKLKVISVEFSILNSQLLSLELIFICTKLS